jgi:hypothetical protein
LVRAESRFGVRRSGGREDADPERSQNGPSAIQRLSLKPAMYRTILHADPPRSQCPSHGVRVVKLPWAEPSSRFTARPGGPTRASPCRAAIARVSLYDLDRLGTDDLAPCLRHSREMTLLCSPKVTHHHGQLGDVLSPGKSAFLPHGKCCACWLCARGGQSFRRHTQFPPAT